MSDGFIMGVAASVKSSGIMTVTVGAQTIAAQANRDVTFAVGDTVVVAKIGSSYHVISREFTAAMGNPDPSGTDEPPTAPISATGTSTFIPVQTLSWRDTFGGWRDDNDAIYQGEYGGNGNHIGCAFYGTQVKTLSGSTVLSASISAMRLQGGDYAAEAVTLGHITEATKPSGEPTFGGGATGPSLAVGATATNFAISTVLAQSLVDGTYGGLGIHISGSTPYIRLAGLSDYSASFALTITWGR